MKTINFSQGSPEWHQFRREKFTASDAAAMLGLSKYKTRRQLLEEKVTGITEEVDENKQRLFDRGHAAEAAARPLVEAALGDDLFPAVGVEDGWDRLAASFDGITMDEVVIWEHKLWNENLVSFIKDNLDLPDTHWPQVEQQLMVSGAEYCIFTISDGTEANKSEIHYYSDPERAEKVLAGWRQFEADMETFQKVEHKEKPDANVIRDLPSLSFNLDRTTLALTSNLDVFKAASLELVERSKKKLESDQDFADAESMVKILKGTEEKLAVTCDNVLGQIQDVDAFVKDLREISELMRQARLTLDKQVKSRKEDIKREIAQKADAELSQYLSDLSVGGLRVSIQPVSFTDAMKNKRTIKSLHDAVDEALAAAKIDAVRVAGVMEKNLVIFEGLGGRQNEFLFRDLQDLAVLDGETFSSIVKTRIDAYRQRLEDERIERERLEAVAKAKASLLPTPEAIAAATEVAPANDNAQRLGKLREVFGDEPVAETITITMDEYNELTEKAALLDALQAAGVDNWDGYPEAIDMMRDNLAACAQ